MNEQEREKLGLECIQLLEKKIPNKMNSEQFSDAIMGLHQKYPMHGHDPQLSQFQLKHYGTILQVFTDPDTGIKYLDHIQPWNFNEAAQMYYWHSRPEYGKEKARIDSQPLSPEQIDRKMEAGGDYEKALF